MATLQTFFRTAVMLATLGLLAKAWYHYGPTVEELQLMGTRAAQVAQEAWTEYWHSPESDASLVGNQHSQPQFPSGPAPFMPPSVEPPSIHSSPAPAFDSPVQLAGGAPPTAPALTAPPATDASSSALVPMEAPIAGDRVPHLLDRLTSLGVRDQELRPWGAAGQLHRFTCSAPLAQSPSFSRHFEAVAETPEAAVERVAAEIDAWYRTRK